MPFFIKIQNRTAEPLIFIPAFGVKVRVEPMETDKVLETDNAISALQACDMIADGLIESFINEERQDMGPAEGESHLYRKEATEFGIVVRRASLIRATVMVEDTEAGVLTGIHCAE